MSSDKDKNSEIWHNENIIDTKFKKILDLQSEIDDPKLKAIAQATISKMLADESVKLRMMILAVGKSKLSMLENLSNIGSLMASAVASQDKDEFIEDFMDLPLSEQLKMIDGVAHNMTKITASLPIIEEMKNLLDDFERGLSEFSGDTSKLTRWKKIVEKMIQLHDLAEV